jgi:hypothetical protein
LVDLEKLLGLALTLTLGLASGSRDEVVALVLGESLSVGPLLIDFGAFVRLANF